MVAFDDTAVQHGNVDEEENYFVSMTDMMVGILFIFIIMLMVFALQFQKQTDTSHTQIQDVVKKIDEIAQQLVNLQKQIKAELDSLDQAQQQRKDLLEDLKQKLHAAGLEVEIDPDNGVLRLTEHAIRFDHNKSNLNAQASENVSKLAGVLAEVLPRYTSCREVDDIPSCSILRRGAAIDTVFIEGHTDTQGSDDRNWELSTQRAVTTYRAITEFQPVLRTLRNPEKSEILSVSGYSSTRSIPGTEIVTADTALRSNLLEQNRRIDMRFVMQVDASDRLKDILRLTSDMEGQIYKLREAAKLK